ETELREALDEIPGAQLERKHFSVAAHYRNVNENDAFRVALAVDAVAARHRELRRMDGKKVYELLPDIDWNKGKAVLWLLETLGLEGRNALPIYIGDDRTDEDAFRALEQRGADDAAHHFCVSRFWYVADENHLARCERFAEITRYALFQFGGEGKMVVCVLLQHAKANEGFALNGIRDPNRSGFADLRMRD